MSSVNRYWYIIISWSSPFIFIPWFFTLHLYSLLRMPSRVHYIWFSCVLKCLLTMTVSSRFWWPWQSWGLLVWCFIEQPSLWICLRCFYDWFLRSYFCWGGEGIWVVERHFYHFILRVSTIAVIYCCWCWPWSLKSFVPDFFIVNLLFFAHHFYSVPLDRS